MISVFDLKSKKRSRTRRFISNIEFETTKIRQSFPVFSVGKGLSGDRLLIPF